jgi:hypothetical protein
MFIGHFALGFAAKRTAPYVSLALLFAAAQLADLLWPFLLLAGVERVEIVPGITAFTPLDFVSYPWSHSLLTLIVWSIVFGFVSMKMTRGGPLLFTTLAALVVSHWLLDVATHRPDMPVCGSTSAPLARATRSARGAWPVSSRCSPCRTGRTS